jgi:hypothetical protein
VDLEEFSVDFLVPALIDAVLVQRRSLLILPYVNPDAVASLVALLRPYQIERIDANALFNSDIIDLFIDNACTPSGDCLDHQILRCFENIQPAQATRLLQTPNIHFLALCSQSFDFESLLATDNPLVVYNHKTKTIFTHTKLGTPLVGRILVHLIGQNRSLAPAIEMVDRLWRRSQAIVESLMVTGSYSECMEWMDTLEPSEKRMVIEFAERHYGIRELPRGPITTPEYPTPGNQLEVTPSGAGIDAGTKSNEETAVLTQTFLTKIRTRDAGLYRVFVSCLFDVRAALDAPNLYSPDRLLVALLNGPWQTGIPAAFLVWVIVTYVKMQIGSEEVTPKILINHLNEQMPGLVHTFRATQPPVEPSWVEEIHQLLTIFIKSTPGVGGDLVNLIAQKCRGVLDLDLPRKTPFGCQANPTQDSWRTIPAGSNTSELGDWLRECTNLVKSLYER